MNIVSRIRSMPAGRVVVLVLVSLVVVYTVALMLRFSGLSGVTLDYPQRVMSEKAYLTGPGTPLEPTAEQTVNPMDPGQGSPGSADPTAAPDRTNGADGEGAPKDTCARSKMVEILTHNLTVLVEENTWAPGDPMYKIGWFGIASFGSGPVFDNQAFFQLGGLSAVRRVAVELVDLIGRARGTSPVDPDLQSARNAIFISATAWRFNPFDDESPLFATPATTSYLDAREHLRSYNDRLAACEALFDPRADNLMNVLDRIAKNMGAVTSRLADRSKARRWDADENAMVEAEGTNLGIFDFQADNLFYEAKGLMWAYHGILQALRVDFGRTVKQRNLGEVWDRLEEHAAETADLSPWIVSNGAEDAFIMPDHLSVMAANILRARANLTELRSILDR